MNKQHQKLINLFEGFEHVKGVFEPSFNTFEYAAPDHMHYRVTKIAYGLPLKQTCVDISSGKPLHVSLNVNKKSLNRRYYVRISACLTDWEKYYNNLSISVNGVEIYNDDKTLFENVCVGWPVSFYPFDNKLLKEGINEVVVKTTNVTEGGLYIAKVDFMSLPPFEEGKQISSIRYARVGEQFTVAIYGNKKVEIKNLNNLELIEIKNPDLWKDITLIKFKAKEFGKVNCDYFYNGKKDKLLFPKIIKASTDHFLVGIDNDDNRHDYTEEGNRVPIISAITGMTNYFQFRPQGNRNTAVLPDEKTFTDRVHFLGDFDMKYSLCDPQHFLDFVPNIDKSRYVGKHIHEPYLYFSQIIRKLNMGAGFFIDMDKISKAKTFKEEKELYLEALGKIYNKHNASDGYASVGSASLLCIYEAPLFPRVTMEPVSGVNMQIGATRASSKFTWGSHVPICWYYGYYNDINKSRKYWSTMFYLYLNNADYVYAENSLFKAQCMSREDWDTPFCIDNRRFTREMLDYSISHPREGKLTIDLAVIYGNNEFFLWQRDSRIAELEEGENWDITIWGKYKENYQMTWRGIDAWLPPAENQNTVDDKFNLKLHSGTRFGSVDVIPYNSDYSKYKVLALLGWNTYEEEFSKKAYEYVNNGGTLILSFYHFNHTDRCDLPFEFKNDEHMENLLGMKYEGLDKSEGQIAFNDGTVFDASEMEIGRFSEGEATPIAYDEKHHPIVYQRNIGKGKLIFITFAKYNTNDWGIKLVQKIMKEEALRVSHSYIINNDNIAYTERLLNDGSYKYNFINMSTSNPNKQKFTINVKTNNKIISKTIAIRPCEVKEYIFKNK